MRDLSNLEGKHTASENNAPVSLVAMEFPGNPYYMTDIDADFGDVYLNRSSGAMQHVPATGFDLFLPTPGLKVPTITLSDQTIQDDMTITIANPNRAWFQIVGANAYRDSLVTVWQGQLDVSSSSPELFNFTEGGVRLYVGRVSGNLHVTRETATILVKPHVVPFTVTIPYRIHDASQFKRLPPANKKLTWGFTVRTE